MHGHPSPQDLIRQEILRSRAYHVAPAAGLVKLDAMENPYRLPDALQSEWLRLLGNTSISRYPDAGAGALKEKLYRCFDIPRGCRILLGNGSDEIIQIICTALALPEAVLLAPEPSFVMYRICALMSGLRYVGIPLTADFAVDGDAMIAAMNRHRPAVAFIAQPNNPTGKLMDAALIERLVVDAPGLVVVDEAYQGFARISAMSLTESCRNLLVMRTLSKVGLAGLRLGFVVGPEQWIEEFDKVRLPYNIGSLTQASVSFFLDHLDVFDAQARQIVASRDVLAAELARFPGIEVWPSAANFLLFRHCERSSASIYTGLLQRGVLIRDLDGMHPLLARCLRVSIGTEQDNQKFMDSLAGVLSGR